MPFQLKSAQEAINDFYTHITSQYKTAKNDIWKNKPLSEVQIYLLEQNRSILRDIEAFKLLIASNDIEHSLAIVRMAVDRITKLSYLSTLETSKQIETLFKESLQFYKIHYHETDNSTDKQLFQAYFEETNLELVKHLNASDNSKIDIEREGMIRSFPAFKDRIKSNKNIVNMAELKFLYELSSEIIHGNYSYLQYGIKNSGDLKCSYRLMLAALASMTKINDWYLNNKLSSVTIEILDKHSHLGD